MFGLEYYDASDEATLKEVMQDFYSSSEVPRLLEIFTPSTLNDEVLLNYFDYIK